MMTPTSNHLTDEQLYDLLDRPTLAQGTHLHVCATCQQELASLRASLENFRLAATNLAAADLPPLVLQRELPAAPRFAFRTQAFAATFATAAVLLAASATLLRPHHGDPAIPAAPTTVSTPESDAALLDGIQRDLSASVPPSLAPLEVTPATTSLDPHN